jgi:hypothetical protein
MSARLRHALGLGLLAASCFASLPAWCEDSAHNKDLATDLFDAGVRKMRQGACDQATAGDRKLCAEARDAFRRSYSLYPAGLGALRNLAYVEKSLGLVASAARSFRELARRAPLDPNPARRPWAEFAQQEVEALAPRVPRLTLEIERGAAQVQVVLDGQALPDAAWRTALDIDPGPHSVRAEAPGREPFEANFELSEAEHERLSIVFKERAPAPAPKSAPQARPSAPVDEQPQEPKRVLPLVVSGIGVATLGVGLGLGYVAIKKRQSACGDGHYCEPDELESGRKVARASTIVTGVGAATLAGGLVWYFLSGQSGQERSATVTPTAGPQFAGLTAHGSF